MKLEKEMRLATVMYGPNADRIGNVMAEYTDGECIVDFGNNELCYEEASNLEFWTSVSSIEIIDGKVILRQDGKIL